MMHPSAFTPRRAQESIEKEEIINGWIVREKIAQGKYAEVYQCTSLDQNRGGMVLKQSSRRNDGIIGCKRFGKEYSILCYLHELRVGMGYRSFTKVFWLGKVNNRPSFLMEQHGVDLKRLHDGIGKFSMKDVLLVGISVLRDVEFLHFKAGVFHRDIHWGNVVVGLPEQKKHFYLIDFGESRRLTSQKHSLSRLCHSSSLTPQQIDLTALLLVLEKLMAPKPEPGSIEGLSSLAIVRHGLVDTFSSFRGQINAMRTTECSGYQSLFLLLKRAANKEGVNLDDVPDCLVEWRNNWTSISR